MRLAAHVPHGRVEHARILRIHDHLGATGAVIAVEKLVPGLAAVGGLEDAALGVGIPEMPEGAGIDGVAIFGMTITRLMCSESAGRGCPSFRRRRASGRCRCRPRRCCATQDSPVPTQTVCGSEGSMAMEPIESEGCLSKMGLKVVPLSTRFPNAAAGRADIDRSAAGLRERRRYRRYVHPWRPDQWRGSEAAHHVGVESDILREGGKGPGSDDGNDEQGRKIAQRLNMFPRSEAQGKRHSYREAKRR